MNNKERRIKKIEEAVNVNDEVLIPIMSSIKFELPPKMSREEFNKLPKETQEAIKTNKYGAK
jgi:hypothetical protein